METKVFTFKQAEGCEFSATIATLGVVDSDNDVLLPGAFGTIQGVPVLPAHDQGHHPIGKATVTEEDDRVIARGEFNTSTAAGSDWCQATKFDLDPSFGPPAVEWSWGFLPTEWRMGDLDGQRVRFIERVDLLEVSPVLRGASVGTGTTCAGDGCKGACCDSCAEGGEREDDLDPELDAAIAARVAIANEVRDAKAKRLVRYKYVDPLPWRTWIWEIGEDLADAAGIPKPTIRLMEEARDDEAADFAHKRDPGGRTLYGLASPDEHAIRLLGGQSVEQTLKTLAHEIGHLVLHRRGKRQSEQACNSIGVKVTKSLISNARRSETYWMREATLA